MKLFLFSKIYFYYFSQPDDLPSSQNVETVLASIFKPLRFNEVLIFFLDSHLPLIKKKRQRPWFTSFQWIYLKSRQVGLTLFCRTHRTFGIKVAPCNHVISIVAACRHWLSSLCLTPTPLISELTWFISLVLHGPVYIEIQERGKGWDYLKINSAGKEINPFINAFCLLLSVQSLSF